MNRLYTAFFTIILIGIMLTSCANPQKESATEKTSSTPIATEKITPKPTQTATLTPSPTPTENALVTDFQYLDLEGIVFTFSSGVGGWSTELEISSDGSFRGYYSDSEMGDSDVDYPNGSLYYSSFNGKFKELKKINDYEYSMKFDYLIEENEEGDERIGEDGIRYVATYPAGFDGADEYLLFLPGAKMKNLPKELLQWVHIDLESIESEHSNTLDFHGLYNVEGTEGFRGSENVLEEKVNNNNISIDTNLDIKDWRQIYAEFLEVHIDSPFEEYYSLYDFDEDGTPELIMASYVEYIPTTFFTVRDGEIKWFKWSTDVYSDFSPYIYYNPTTKLHGIIAPYSKKTPEDYDKIPIYYYNKEEDFVDNGYIMYETQSPENESKIQLFHITEFGDGTSLKTIGKKHNDFYMVSDLTYDYLKSEIFDENKKLPKHLITKDGIEDGISNYKPIDQSIVEDKTGINGFFDYIFQFAEIENKKLIVVDQLVASYNLLATDGNVYQVLFDSLLDKLECTDKNGELVSYWFSNYELINNLDQTSNFETRLYKDIEGNEYIALNYYGKPDANFTGVPESLEYEYRMDKTIYIYFDGENFVLDNEIICYQYGLKRDNNKENKTILLNGDPVKNLDIQNKYKYIEGTTFWLSYNQG